MSRSIPLFFLFSGVFFFCFCVGAGVGVDVDVNVNDVGYSPAIATQSFILAKVAMCQENDIKNWTCGESCDSASSISDVTVFNNSTFQSQGYSGYDSVNDRFVLSFRGSTNTLNWIEDFVFFLTPYTFSEECGNQCQVHQGFLAVYASLRARVLSSLANLFKKYPNTKNLLVTGHSLGASTALLATGDVLASLSSLSSLSLSSSSSSSGSSDVSNLIVTLYTFGCPRVGNQAYVEWLQKKISSSSPLSTAFRVTHHFDPVPRLPPAWLPGSFVHLPHEVYYAGDGDGYSPYVLCSDSVGADDRSCIAGNGIVFNPNDHTKYLGLISKCHNTSMAHTTYDDEGEQRD